MAGEGRPVRASPRLVRWLMIVCLAAAPAIAGEQVERTANLPDSWLVLYNLNSADSVAWADWYQAQRGIPGDHFLGLDAALTEHLPDLAAVQAQIITPVRDLLAEDVGLHDSVMGIVLGYALPGHYATPPFNPTVGGFSVADALQDIYDDGLQPASQKDNNMDNPHYCGQTLPPGGRLTRATMAADKYMVARIDGPTLADAQALTERALVLGRPDVSLYGDSVWYDYFDPSFPSSNHEWYWLKYARNANLLATLPWSQFDLDIPEVETPNAAFLFAIYKLYGWSAADFAADEPGRRVVAFHFNSYGAVTVRSTTGEGGLFVPNALAAGYAVGIGATGEPQCCVSVFPDTLLAALGQGWTLGEAYYLANPFDDWMWTLVGDPFLTVPNWFSEVDPATGDINADGMINLPDYGGFRGCLRGAGQAVPEVCAVYDFDHDADCDLRDYAAFQGRYTGEPADERAGDSDGDGDIDLQDFAAFNPCMTTPGPLCVDPECDRFDLDWDLDIDLEDFAQLQSIITLSTDLPDFTVAVPPLHTTEIQPVAHP